MEFLKGLMYCIFIVTILKLVSFKYFRRPITTEPVKWSFNYWIKNNWMDYVIQVGTSLLFVEFSHEIILSVNPVLKKFISWQIPHVENTLYYFILIPIIITLVTYKFFRKRISQPIQDIIIPHNKTVNNPNPKHEEK